jgi:hypothetical protein
VLCGERGEAAGEELGLDPGEARAFACLCELVQINGVGPAVVDRFVLASGLLKVKPDVRHLGFNNPAFDPSDPSSHGYEMWVTIPDGFAVPAPLVKKRFLGGLYAAHAIVFGAFDHWALLHEWVTKSPDFAVDFESTRCEPSDPAMDRCLEEHLNYFHNVQDPTFDISRMQLDLLLPIR